MVGVYKIKSWQSVFLTIGILKLYLSLSIPVEFIGNENTTKTKILRFCSKFVFLALKEWALKENSQCAMNFVIIFKMSRFLWHLKKWLCCLAITMTILTLTKKQDFVDLRNECKISELRDGFYLGRLLGIRLRLIIRLKNVHIILLIIMGII